MIKKKSVSFGLNLVSLKLRNSPKWKQNFVLPSSLSKLDFRSGNSWEEGDILLCSTQKLNSVPLKWLWNEVTVICISITFIMLHPGELLWCVSSQQGLAFLLGWIRLASFSLTVNGTRVLLPKPQKKRY